MSPCPKLIKQLHTLKDENSCLDFNFWFYKKFQENKSFIKTLELNDDFTVIQDLIVEAEETYLPKKANFTKKGYKKAGLSIKLNTFCRKNILWTEYL